MFFQCCKYCLLGFSFKIEILPGHTYFRWIGDNLPFIVLSNSSPNSDCFCLNGVTFHFRPCDKKTLHILARGRFCANSMVDNQGHRWIASFAKWWGFFSKLCIYFRPDSWFVPVYSPRTFKLTIYLDSI